MKRLLLITFLFFYGGSAWATCNTTVTENISGNLNILCNDNDTYVINEGVTVHNTSGNYYFDVQNHSGVTITNNGTLKSNYHQGLLLNGSSDTTINNNGTIHGNTSTIMLKGHAGDITINNTGTISSDNHGTISNYAAGVSGDISIINSGTIKGAGGIAGSTNHNSRWVGVIALEGCTSSSANCSADTDSTYTITNSGTIEQTTYGYYAVRVGNHSGASITNTGTIIGGPETAVTVAGAGTRAIGMDILVMKCVNTAKFNNCGDPDAGNGDKTTTIKIGDGAVFTNGIDLNGTKANIVIDTDIKRDYSIRIFDYVEEGTDNLTITNNSTGTTYSISEEVLTFSTGDTNVYGNVSQTKEALTGGTIHQHTGQGDSGTNKAEYYNAGADGILTILGEKLEVEKDNQEYRAENTLTKLRGLFTAANYAGGEWPDYCITTDPRKTEMELNEICNQRFVKLFHSHQKRDGIYDGTSSGAVGMLSPIKWKGRPIVSNVFVGYSNQKGDFDNGEYLGGDNYVLGVKNTYEKKGFRASITPMIGLNDLGVIDFDTDKVETKAANFLSEFGAINGKIDKKIGVEDRYLNISIDGTYGLQRFPEYLSKFTDGDLSVDESIEQLLSGGFEVSYSETLPGNFVIKPYIGASINRNLNDTINITARSKNADVTNDNRETWSGYHAGVSLVKKAKDLNFDLDLMYGNEDGLINQIAAISLTKSFGKAKAKTAALEKTPDFPKIDESLTTQDYDKDLKELETLKKLNKKLKAENTALKAQNEKLKLLAEKKIQQEKAKEKLIVELLKESEKLKLTNQIFKNKILDNKNEALLRSIEEEAKKSESNKLAMLYFLAIYITTVLLLTSLIASLYNKIRYGFSRQDLIS